MDTKSVNQLNTTFEVYEKPTIEIIEFSLGEGITTSANFGPDTLCSEGIGM